MFFASRAANCVGIAMKDVVYLKHQLCPIGVKVKCCGYLENTILK